MKKARAASSRHLRFQAALKVSLCSSLPMVICTDVERIIRHTPKGDRRMFRTVCQLLTVVLLLLSASSICAAQENKKFGYGILVDSTGSMRSQFATVLDLAKAVARQVHDHGPVSIFSFDSEGMGRASRAVPAARIENTQDEDLLNRTIDGVYVQGGQTTLLDAVEFIAQRLNQQLGATDKIIVLITDGEDRVSTAKQEQLIQKLKDSKIRVYAVGLVQELDDYDGFVRKNSRSKAIKLLTTLTRETGGRVVFPKSAPVEIQNLLTELAIPIQ